MSYLEDALAKARSRPGFMDRLHTRMQEDKHILDRLHDKPCPAKETAVLGLKEPVLLPCGLLEGHKGPHYFYLEWID